jgi:hypothetical protein
MHCSPPSPRPSSARLRRGAGRAASYLGSVHFTTIRLWLRHFVITACTSLRTARKHRCTALAQARVVFA